MEDIDNWQKKFKCCYYSTRLLDKLSLLDEESKIDMFEVRKAIYYAKKYHGNQKRRSGEPFYTHPLEVAYMISEHLCDTHVIVAAILHDTIEDTMLTKQMIDKIFGAAIANQVEDLTRIKLDKKVSAAEMIRSLWYQKKYDTLLIKLFDRLHNMQTLRFQSTRKKKIMLEEYFASFMTLSVYFRTIMPKMLQVEEEMYKICCHNLPVF